MAKVPRVFISYSHESKEHGERVLSLAMRLRQDGIDASMDRLAPQNPAGGWPDWMEKQIREADFVLLICTEEYLRRVEQRFEEQRGRGVFWEVTLVHSYLYESKGRDARFIPIFFSDDDEKWVPRTLQGSRYCIATPSGYESLYRLLTNQPEVSPGGLGPIKEYPTLVPKPLAFAPETAVARLDEESEFVQLKALASQLGQDATLIRFENHLDEEVALYWLDYGGQRVFYAALAPGQTYQQRTHVTHPWVVARKDAALRGECLAIFLAAAEPGIAAINQGRVSGSR